MRICSVNMIFFFSLFSSNFSLLLIYRCAHPRRQPHQGAGAVNGKKASDVGIISTFHPTRSIQIVALSLPLLVMTTDGAGFALPFARRIGLTTAPVGGSVSDILLLYWKCFQCENPSLKCTFALLEWSNLLKFACVRGLWAARQSAGGDDPSLRHEWIHPMRRIGRRSEENYSHQRSRSH